MQTRDAAHLPESSWLWARREPVCGAREEIQRFACTASEIRRRRSAAWFHPVLSAFESRNGWLPESTHHAEFLPPAPQNPHCAARTLRNRCERRRLSTATADGAASERL